MVCRRTSDDQVRPRRTAPTMASRTRCTVMQRVIIALLTVAAIQQKDSLDEKF